MEFNFKQLVFAREYMNISQTELSSKIKGLSQSNLSKFEKGIGSLSPDVLKRIIDYLGFPETFYEKIIYNRIENAQYRRKSGISKAKRINIDCSNKLLGYIIDQMGESVDFPDMNIQTYDVEDGFSPENIARFTRKYLGLKDEPVLNIFSLLENNGIIVKEYDYDENIFDGVSFQTDGGHYVIIINKNFSNDHKRFTLAHELGHIIMHFCYIIPDYRNIEDEAHRFAAEFLMPENLIKSSLLNLKMKDLASIKSKWLTSMASLIKRAKELHCIDQNRYTFFNVELSRLGYKKSEPVIVPIDRPHLFNDAYMLHRNALAYSDNELADAFSLPVNIITKFCNEQRIKLRVS